MANAVHIADELRSRLAQGECWVREPFLTYRQATEEFMASVGTVRRAYALLRGEGYLLVEQGRVPVVKSLPVEQGVDVLGKLQEAREALALAIRELERDEDGLGAGERRG